MNQIRTYLWLISLVIGSHLNGMTFRKFDMGTGMSHNSALCVAQTKDRYIWIGTRDGLCRFDGVQYRIFKKDFNHPGSLSNNSINCLYVDSKGNLWVGTTMGLNKYSSETGEFQQFIMQPEGKGLSHNYVRTVYESGQGSILIGSPGGVDIYDPVQQNFRRAVADGAARKDPGVYSFLKDGKGNLWVGMRNGLFLLKGDTLKKCNITDQGNSTVAVREIRDIREDSSGMLWLATEGSGLYLVSPEKDVVRIMRHYTRGNSKLGSDQVRRILPLNHEIWIGTLEGLSILDTITGKMMNYRFSVSNPEGLSNNSIRDICIDNQGGIWIATYAGGVNYYHPQNNLFPHFQIPRLTGNTQLVNVVSCFMEDAQKNLWIGTEGSGVIWLEQPGGKTKTYTSGERNNSLTNNNIKSLTKDGSGNIWIGTYNGLSCYDPAKNHFSSFRNIPGNPNSLVNNQVHALFMDRDSLLWIGTNGGGLQTYHPASGKFTPFLADGVKNVNVLMADSERRLWIGHQSGLACIDLRSGLKVGLSEYLKQLPVTIQYVQSLYGDHSGRLWIGTQGYGLFLINGTKISWYHTAHGLPDNTINAVTEDEKGEIWISTNKGISKIAWSEGNGDFSQAVIRTYTRNQGLQELQFLPGSVMETGSGELLFGGINGFNRFYPEAVIDIDFSPELRITGFSAGSSRNDTIRYWPDSLYHDGDVPLKLDHRSRNITIGYVGFNFIDPAHTWYRYKLTGIDDEWVTPVTDRFVRFSYLPPGEYRFQLQSSSNPAVWGNDFKTLSFTVLPPWWKTGWAFFGYFLVMTMMLFLFFYLSQRWINLKNLLKMEHFQREKEEELHQLKQKFFTDISHELRTPLTLISAPLEQMSRQNSYDEKNSGWIRLIQQNVSRMKKLITNFLDLQKLDAGHLQLKATRGNLTEFVSETGKTFWEAASLNKVELLFHFGDQPVEAYYDREKLEIILFNLLSNALKNTPEGGKIMLGIKKKVGESHYLAGGINAEFAEITVWDNGNGIPEDIRERIFERFFVSSARDKEFKLGTGIGLELTRRLVELHRGKISVESRLSEKDHQGFTCLTILLPLGKDHLQPSEIIEEPGDGAGERSTFSFRTDTMEGEFHLPDGADDESRKVRGEEEKLSMLVIEDNREMRLFIKGLFAPFYEVEEAADGEEALIKAFDRMPDLIISDIMMPGMDGLTFCRRIKTDIRTSHIPVILLTAKAGEHDQLLGLETGADDYVVKPFSPENLQMRVKNLLYRQQLLRAQINREFLCEPEKVHITSSDEKLLRKAVEYIGQHMSETTLGVESLSSELGLSRVHLYRKIKALTNLSAIEFIRNIRLKRAEALLRDKKMNINEISLMVGFEDADYFRACFKRTYGMTPREFAENSGS